jgi:hypothetical protein
MDHWPRLKGAIRVALLVAFLPAFFLWADISAGGSSELDEVLRDWITQNIALERTPDGKDVLLRRKLPVRAYIRVDDPVIAADARATIANFAEAFGLEHEFTSSNINMVVATADRVAEKDGKPRMELLQSFGLTGSNTDFIKDLDWSTGCGYYGSRAPQERFLTFSIVAGSEELTKQRLKSCIMTGIIIGFGMRTIESQIINSTDGYLQYLILGRANKECDDEATAAGQPTSSRMLIDCVYQKMRPKFR